MPFPQLQTLSSFSLLKSTLRLESYVATGKKLGYQALALTDINQLTGAIQFAKLAETYQIQPIIGLYLEYEWGNQTQGLLLYVKNLVGYENLIKLSTLKETTENLTLDEILIRLEGLVAVLPFENPAYEKISTGDRKGATEFLQLFASKKAAKEFFVGITLQEKSDLFLLRLQNWLEFLAEKQTETLFLHPVTYLKSEEAFSLEVLKALAEGQTLDLLGTEKKGPHYLWTQAEFQEALAAPFFKNLRENTLAFSKSFHFSPPLGQKLLPHFPLPEGKKAPETLREMATTALEKRVEKPAVPLKDYYKRLSYELSVIERMGFSDYFLIVTDVMHYCHTHNIMTGAGRGSAAGSLVAYVLEITDVDPLKYQLLFERFLNPERANMPDIDLDIPDLKREEVLRYVAEKYGKRQVAQIATFGTLAAKMVLRDVARVFGLSQSEASQFSKAVPNTPKITLRESYKKSESLRKLALKNEKYQLLFETALLLEGLPRHVSTHAAGVVIGDGPLVQWVPLQTGSNDIYLTQFTMGDVEAVGLLKIDFLGVKNLTILQETTENVSRLLNRPFSLHEIPLDDALTLAVFQKGETSGIFQFESQGIRSVLKRLGPTSFEDIVAVNALFRPGPLDNIDHFIKRKKGQEPITYPDASIKEVLAHTYGIIVYQEQVMQVANLLAGFSLGQADILRRAVSKKKRDVLDATRQAFIKGALKQGHSEKVAGEVYDYIEKFANYGFNRSHAFAYSVVGFQLAYFKAHYPKAFYTALLNSVVNNDGKIKNYLGEAKKAGVKILPPDINQSSSYFTMVKEGIRFGLGKIKGVRRDFLKEVLAERKLSPFASLDDFLFRLDNRWLKEEVIAPLVMVGAFTGFEKNRRKLLEELPGKIRNVVYSAGSMDLLTTMALKTEEIADYPLTERLEIEEDYLGTFISGHPLEETTAYEKYFHITPIADYEANQKIQTFIYLKDIKKIRTKNKEQMAFLTAQDLTGETSYTLFPQLYRKEFGKIQLHQLYFVKGKVEYSKYQDQLQVLVESLATFEEIKEELNQPKLYLRIPESLEKSGVLQTISQELKNFSGKSPVILYYPHKKISQQLSKTYQVEPTESLLENLKKILGNENVILKN